MTAGSAASRRVLARTPVAPLPASSPTRPTGITGRMSAPPETSSPGVCSFRLPLTAPTGRPAGSLGWAGLANSFYWIDPKNGIGGVYATQIDLAP